MSYYIYQEQRRKKYRVKAYSMKNSMNLIKYIKVLLSLLLKQFVWECKKEDSWLKSVSQVPVQLIGNKRLLGLMQF